MPAGTVALTNGSTAVTGTSTDLSTELASGDFMVVVSGGITYVLPVSSIASATAATLASAFTGPTASGLAYTVIKKAAQMQIPAQIMADAANALRVSNLNATNWASIFSNSSSVTVTTPTGTTYTGPGWVYLANQMANKLSLPTANTTEDLNTLVTPGVYSIPSGTSNTPITANGILLILAIGSQTAVTQVFYSVSTNSGTVNRIWSRVATTANTTPVWTAWISNNLLPLELSSSDLNSYTTPGTYYGDSFTNGPSSIGNASAMILVMANGGVTVTTQTLIATSSGQVWNRTYAGGAWTAWVQLLTTASAIGLANGGTGGTTAETARTGLGLGSLATLSAVDRGQLTGEPLRNLMASGAVTANTKGAGVWTFNNTPFAFSTQYGTCLQLSNRSDSADTAGTGVWQHYLALGTNGEIIYAYNVNGTYSARKVYTTGNTTTNSSGAIVPASPICRVVNNKATVTRSDILGVDNSEYQWQSDYGLVNEESDGCVISKTATGTYLIVGATSLATNLWNVMDCGNGQGRIIALAEVEQTSDGIVVRCYKQKYTLSDDGDLDVTKGDIMDIPDGSWIDVRLLMPDDSIYNQKMKVTNDQVAAAKAEQDAAAQAAADAAAKQAAENEASEQASQSSSTSTGTEPDDSVIEPSTD